MSVTNKKALNTGNPKEFTPFYLIFYFLFLEGEIAWIA